MSSNNEYMKYKGMDLHNQLQSVISHLAFSGDREVFFKQFRESKTDLCNGEAQNFDQIFLERIIETMQSHSRHQPRRNILYQVLSHLIQRGLIDINLALTTIAMSMDLTNYPQLWLQNCDLISDNLTRASLPTLQIILTQILSKLQAIPIIISPSIGPVFIPTNPFSQTSQQIFSCGERGVQVLHCFLTQPPILPTYKLITTVQKFYKKQEKRIRPHWILQSFTDIVFSHKQNLANFLIPAGRVERYRMLLKYRDNLVSQGQLLVEHHMIDCNTAGIENGQQGNELWQKGVHTLLQMLCDQAPIGTVLRSLISSQFDACVASDIGKAKPSQMLMEACVLRVKQLIAFVDHKMHDLNPNQKNSALLQQIYEDWWGEWHRFGSQFFNFVEQGMIDFESFVCKVAQNKLRDNGLIWLICQCLMIEKLKGYFMEDITEHNGWLTSTILSFHRASQSEQFIAIRDTSVDCLIYRTWAIFGKESKKYLVNAIVPPSINNRTSDLDSRRQWWYQNQDSIDYYTPGDDQLSVCLLSNFSSIPIVNKMYEFLVSQQEGPPLPGNLLFKGRIKPLSIYLLSCLSMKAHQRLLSKLEDALFSQNTNIPESPGVIETYVRLMCTAPTDNRFKFHDELRSARDKRLHVFMEISNFRLFRFFRFNQALKWSIIDYYEALMETRHHQLYNALENSFIKASLYQNDASSFRAVVEKIDFGITANRVFLLSIARTINLHGISDYSSLTEKLPPLCQHLIRLTGAHTWTKSARFFPNKLREILNNELEQNQSPPYVSSAAVKHPPIIKAHVDQLLSTSRLGSVGIHSEHQPFDTRFWLPIVLSLKKQETMQVQLLNIAQSKLVTLSPIEYVHVTYEFVDFLLDEFVQLNPKSLAGEDYYAEPMQQPQIQAFGRILDEMIWINKLILFNRFLLALADRDDDPNAYLFIEYFLLHSRYASQYIQRYLAVRMNPHSWEEDNYYQKMSEYFRECPPTECEFKDQPLYPIYYGNFPLRLLPVLDCLVMRFIETGHVHLLPQLFNESQFYGALYAYHEAPATFVKDLFHYYYYSEFLTPEIKASLLQIATRNPSIQFSQALSTIRAALVTQDINTMRDEFQRMIQQHIVTPLHNVTKTTPTMSPREPISISFHTFKEFGTQSERVLTTCVLEILQFPTALGSELVQAILSPIRSIHSCITSSFALLNSIGLLFASLPYYFATDLLKSCFEILCDDPILQGFGNVECEGPRSNPLSLCFYTEHSVNLDPLLSNRANAIVTLLHSFFHYATIEIFDHFAFFVGDVSKKVRSYHHLYILCRLLAPWIYRISKNIPLIDNIMYSLFDYMREVDQQCSVLTFDSMCDVTQSNNTNSILWLQDVIIDFLFHMNSISAHILSDPVKQEDIASLIDQFSAPIKAKFRYFFHK